MLWFKGRVFFPSHRFCFRGSRRFSRRCDKSLLSVFWIRPAQRWLGLVYQGCGAKLPRVGRSERAPNHLFSLTPWHRTGDIMTCGVESGKIPPVHLRRRHRTAVAPSKRRAGKSGVGKENKWKRERKEAISEGLAGVVVLLRHHRPACLNLQRCIWKGLGLWLWG